MFRTKRIAEVVVVIMVVQLIYYYYFIVDQEKSQNSDFMATWRRRELLSKTTKLSLDSNVYFCPEISEETVRSEVWIWGLENRTRIFKEAYLLRDSRRVSILVMFRNFKENSFFNYFHNDEKEANEFYCIIKTQWVRATLSFVAKNKNFTSYVAICDLSQTRKRMTKRIGVSDSLCSSSAVELNLLTPSPTSSKLTLCMAPHPVFSLDSLKMMEWVAAHHLLLRNDVNLVIYYKSTSSVSRATLNFLNETFDSELRLMPWNASISDPKLAFNHCLLLYAGHGMSHTWLMLEPKHILVPVDIEDDVDALELGLHYLPLKRFTHAHKSRSKQLITFLDSSRMLYRSKLISSTLMPLVSKGNDEIFVIGDSFYSTKSNVSSYYYDWVRSNERSDSEGLFVVHEYLEDGNNASQLALPKDELVLDRQVADYLFLPLNKLCRRLSIGLSFYNDTEPEIENADDPQANNDTDLKSNHDTDLKFNHDTDLKFNHYTFPQFNDDTNPLYAPNTDARFNNGSDWHFSIGPAPLSLK